MQERDGKASDEERVWDEVGDAALNLYVWLVVVVVFLFSFGVVMFNWGYYYGAGELAWPWNIVFHSNEY